MLFISARPEGQQPLNTDREREAIAKALERSRAPLYVLRDHPAASRGDIIGELAKERPGVLHISCHGEKQVGLLLQDERDGADPVPPEFLVKQVEQNPTVGLVTLSACYSAEHALAVAAARNIDAVGVLDRLGEHFIRTFFEVLYDLLAHGLDIATAFVRAVGAVPEAIQPQFVRAGPGVFPAELVQVDPPAPDRVASSPLSFIPSNIDFADVDIDALGDLVINDINVEANTESKSSGSEFAKVQFKLVKQRDGSRIGVYFARNVEVLRGASLVLRGRNAGAVVALETMAIYGMIDASPRASNGPSPGGFQNDRSDNPDAGGPGGGMASGNMNASGGGSYGGVGGHGAALPGRPVAAPGKCYGTMELVPLVGGSAGGSLGGSGGGALQLVAGTTIVVESYGKVNSGGGGGQTGGAAGWQHGHGGGSGGAILLEAPQVIVSGVLAANGGGAGAGHMGSLYAQSGLAGDVAAAGTSPSDLQAMPGAHGSAAAMLNGEDGRLSPDDSLSNIGQKAGGGGGGAGRIRINTQSGTAVITGIVSPPLGTPCATQGTLRPRD